MTTVLSPFLPVDPRLKKLFFPFFTYSREDRTDLKEEAVFILVSPEFLYSGIPSLKSVKNRLF